MIKDSELLACKEKLGLRKLSRSQTHLKKKTVTQLVIGYVHKTAGFDAKINFLTEPLGKDNISDLEAFLIPRIESFKSALEPVLQKGIDIQKKLEESNSPLLQEFKSAFSGMLGTFATKEIKIENLLGVYKQLDKKTLILDELKREEEKVKSLIASLQIQEYHAYFNRNFKRKLRLYIGPTNSGKTYRALNDLASHEKGTYLSPLRLLAWEGKEELEKRGKVTNLITGEERQIEEGATFKAQTIETLNFSEIVDAILIDEVQMLFDSDRGWAWTQALIGAPCRELIMAGSPEAEPLVQRIADLLGESLEIIRLERFNPLEVNPNPFNLPADINKLPEGTAIIAFSRKNVLAYKDYFKDLGIQTSVIYGNLSPEVRKEESRKFRDGETKFLISTDAIAMGLNLPISNVLFSTTEKFNGHALALLEPMEVKQIAGRAGRFGKKERGEVSCMHKGDVNFIKSMLKSTGRVNNFLYIKPSLEHIKRIGQELSTDRLFTILTFFGEKIMMANRNNLYVCANLEVHKSLAYGLDQIPEGLSLEDKFLFANAPVPGQDQQYIYLNWIRKYCLGKNVEAPSIKILNPRDFYFDKQLILETYVKMLNLYGWLSFKKPEIFNEGELAQEFKEQANNEIEAFLAEKES